MPMKSAASLPIIDIAGLRAGTPASRKIVAEAIRVACLDHGFFYIAGHGIPTTLMDKVQRETRRFFDLLPSDKLAVSRDLSRCRRGYEPMGGQILEWGALPERKEAFDLGIELPADDLRVLEGKADHGPNLWPKRLIDFRPTMESYFQVMLELSGIVLEGLAASLQLPEGYFNDLRRDPVVFLRLLHYPTQPTIHRAGEKGAGAHTDWGAFTLLWQDQVGGLQLLDHGGTWIDVPPIPGCYVVNLGDLMGRWTNDLYRSTVHRVVNKSGRDRYSVAFFFDGNPDHCVESLAGCVSGENPTRYEPITVAAHTAEMYRRALAKVPLND